MPDSKESILRQRIAAAGFTSRDLVVNWGTDPFRVSPQNDKALAFVQALLESNPGLIAALPKPRHVEPIEDPLDVELPRQRR